MPDSLSPQRAHSHPISRKKPQKVNVQRLLEGVELPRFRGGLEFGESGSFPVALLEVDG